MKRFLPIFLLPCAAFAASEITLGPFQRFIPNASLNWASAVTVPTFNTNLGSLRKVIVTTAAVMDAQAYIENQDNVEHVAALSLASTFTTKYPDNSGCLTNAPQYSRNDNLGAYDLNPDFAGTSGLSLIGFSITHALTNTAVYPSGKLALFQGDGSATVSLAIGATNNSTYTAGPSYISEIAALGRVQVNVSYVYYRYGHIGDLVWNDANSNGSSSGETGVAGVLMTLTDINDVAVPYVEPVYTDANGTYLFTNAPPGTYRVAITVPGGATQTYELDGTLNGKTQVTVADYEEDHLNLDFGLHFASSLVSISGHVFYDDDSDTLVGVGEDGIADRIVELYDGLANLVSTDTTDASGVYSFTSLVPGNYTLTIANPPTDYAGFDVTGDPDGSGTPNTADVDASASLTDQDFGYYGAPIDVITPVYTTNGISRMPPVRPLNSGRNAPVHMLAGQGADGAAADDNASAAGFPGGGGGGAFATVLPSNGTTNSNTNTATAGGNGIVIIISIIQ